jgi:hypothetical protein
MVISSPARMRRRDQTQTRRPVMNASALGRHEWLT